MASKPVVPELKNFASRVVKIRKLRELSQTAMSHLSQCSLPTIQDVEASRMPLPGKSFLALYDEGLDLNWLAGGDVDGAKMLRSNIPLGSGNFRADLFQKVVEEVWKNAGPDISAETAGMIALNLYEIFALSDNLTDLPVRAKSLADMLRTVK